MNVPVVCVGNISAGGTGKTPISEFLVDWCLNRNLRVAYLSRGYGRKSTGFLIVPSSNGSTDQFGDEAKQVSARFPNAVVAVCEDRVAGARRLIDEFKVEIIILDDAFQHRRIQRDLNWVVVDANIPPSRDFLIPAGRLRESRKGLKRADAIIVNKINDVSQTASLKQEFVGKLVAFCQIAPLALRPFFNQQNPPKALTDTPIHAFSGIGNNDQFNATLTQSGAKVLDFLPFPDHHLYSEADMLKILGNFSGSQEKSGNFTPGLIVTTEKDFHRLSGMPWLANYADQPLFYLPIGLKWLEGEAKLLDSMLKMLNRYDGRNQ